MPFTSSAVTLFSDRATQGVVLTGAPGKEQGRGESRMEGVLSFYSFAIVEIVLLLLLVAVVIVLWRFKP